MVTAMLNEQDPELARVFAQAREPLADEQFIANLLRKIDHARRTRMWRQIFAIFAVMIIVSLNMRLVLDTTAGAVRGIGDFLATSTELLTTRWGWAASMLVGAWVVFRTRPSRR
ncbi:MAG TPA: hypothetical protein VNZ53_49310 [Steroidobacteraceae bacterium]|jgi:hypothetical protein|nr:hypothetical protein [Steroidobacteraceae bacterium]